MPPQAKLPLARRVKQSLVRALYPRGSVRRVIRGPLRGARFVVQPGMGGAFGLGVDSYGFAFFRSRIRPGDVVFDVGGNCGQLALLFSMLIGPTGKVVTFEPLPSNHETLVRNLQLNHCDNVDARPIAVGRRRDRLKFDFDPDYRMRGNLAGFSGGDYQWSQSLEVDCDSLDNVTSECGLAPTWLKIDVEGAGGEVLAGAEQLIREHSPEIVFEMHATTEESPEFRCLKELRDRHGYSLRLLDGSSLDRLAPEWGMPVWCTKTTS